MVNGDIALVMISVTSENATSNPISAANAAEEVIGVVAICRIRMV